MLTILQFDAASAAVLERLLADDSLPALASLRDRGVWRDLHAPATQFAAGAQYTLYSGVPIEDHGLFYPFQWSPEDQRAKYMHEFPAPAPIWERLGHRQGTRTLAVDPYESRPPTDPAPGIQTCGWQLHDRVVLRQWSQPTATHARLERLFGPPEPVDEVFGPHTANEMLGLRRRLLGAPGRVAEATCHLLDRAGDDGGAYDLTWATFCAAHIAGHQFWDLSQITESTLDADAERILAGTLDDVYRAVDGAMARILAALPDDGDLIVLSPVGMDVNTSRADLLPEMLGRILAPRAPTAGDAGVGVADGAPVSDPGDNDGAGQSIIWKLRAKVPANLRATVANALPEKVALELTSRLELRGIDWSTTQAFAHPAENQGYVRLNLRGRERDGIVDPSEADAVLDRLIDGISTFTHADGSPAVASVTKVADTFAAGADGTAEFGAGSHSHLLPDLVVRWVDTPATRLDALVSERFGTVHRHGVGSGRSGNHTEGDAWALLVPGTATVNDALDRAPRLEDIAATAAALCGDAAVDDLAGTPLLFP